MRISTSEVKDALVERARALGFDAVRVTRPDAVPLAAERLRAFLEAGQHGDMGWMEARAEQRGDPRKLWPEARSVIMLGLNYGPARDPADILKRPDRGAVSVYARADDYHEVMKPRLKALGRWLAESTGTDLKVFVDTAPVMEKPLAAAAGLGWQGKHTNLVSRKFGSWLFLGAIFTTLELPPDQSERDHCGSCRACLDACPTAAFPAPYRLDARRCISYLTIEARNQIPREFRAAMGNRIYGCDDCLMACPWNKFAETARELRLQARAELEAPRLIDLVGLDDARFRELFRKTAVKRLGRDRFVRNVLVAVGNSGDPALREAAIERLADSSPLVRGMAVWALARLSDRAEFEAIRAAHRPHESDPDVLAEWDAAFEASVPAASA